MTQPAPAASRPSTPIIYLLGLVGGVAGTLAAIYEGFFHGAWLAMLLVGPAIEEACKPLGVIIMLESRPHWLRSRRQVVALSALGALVFATLENILYVHVYHPTGGAAFILWRYTICTALHLTASVIFGLGLAKMWGHIRRTGGTFDIDICFRYYVAAVAVHAVYNTTVFVLELTGALKF